jgi:hypothetical protein
VGFCDPGAAAVELCAPAAPCGDRQAYRAQFGCEPLAGRVHHGGIAQGSLEPFQAATPFFEGGVKAHSPWFSMYCLSQLFPFGRLSKRDLEDYH